jgi:hypothetical protein
MLRSSRQLPSQYDGTSTRIVRNNPLAMIRKLQLESRSGKVPRQQNSSIVPMRPTKPGEKKYLDEIKKQFHSEMALALNEKIKISHRYTGTHQRDYIYERLGEIGSSHFLESLSESDETSGEILHWENMPNILRTLAENSARSVQASMGTNISHGSPVPSFLFRKPAPSG